MITVDLDTTNLIEAFARLKGVPVSKVVRNAARDFVFTANKMTPLAKKSRSDYYTFTRPQDSCRVFIHKDYPYLSKLRRRLKDAGVQFGKVRIAKGWSRFSWLKAAEELGIELKAIPRIRNEGMKYAASQLSRALVSASMDDTQVAYTIVDKIHFNKLPWASAEIIEAGMKKASDSIVKEFLRALKEQWKKEHQNAN